MTVSKRLDELVVRPFLQRTRQLQQEVTEQKTLTGNLFKIANRGGKWSSLFPNAYSFRREFPIHLYFLLHQLDMDLGSIRNSLNHRDQEEIVDVLTLFTERPTFFKEVHEKGESIIIPHKIHALALYQGIYHGLVHTCELSEGRGEIVGTPMQDLLLDMLLYENEQPFIKKCENFPGQPIGESVREEFQHTARIMKHIYDFDLQKTMLEYVQLLNELVQAVENPEENKIFTLPFYIPTIDRIIPPAKTKPKNPDEKREEKIEQEKLHLKKIIASQKTWDDLDRAIESHYTAASKSLREAELFTIVRVENEIILAPKTRRKKIGFEELIGYEEQKRLLQENTLRLVQDEEANNVFMYGPPGTGKSSMINALLTQYAEKGLRVIEVPPSAGPFLPNVFSQIESSPYKFIILMDEFKVEHKEFYELLKGVIEGSFDGLPQNARLYVVSNYEDSLRIGFKADDTTKKELQGLEDRFGLVVEFANPAEEQQREILKHYLGKKSNGSFDEHWHTFRSYCDKRKITLANPRNIRDFAKTVN